MPKWLHDMGLTAYEYTCTHGVNIKEKTARAIGNEAKKWGITLSIHAPYYINMATPDKDKHIKSKQHLLDSIQAAYWMGATRVVFHPGSCGKMGRSTAFEIAEDFLREVLSDAHGLIQKGIHLCPETMGKKNQLGTLEEVLSLCTLDDSLIPTLDFGHINALGRGSIRPGQDYMDILAAVRNALGEERAGNFHCHFSRVEFSQGGEKKHWTLQDTQYGPEFEPLAELLVKLNLTPIIICESRGTMAEDALELKKMTDSKNPSTQ